MRLLLDTQILIWWLENDAALPPHARARIADPMNDVFVSALSLWEIAIKARLGKIAVDAGQVRKAAQEDGFLLLPFSDEHAIAVAALPDHHRDPFDRALIAQAMIEPLILLTHDRQVAVYGGTILLV